MYKTNFHRNTELSYVHLRDLPHLSITKFLRSISNFIYSKKEWSVFFGGNTVVSFKLTWHVQRRVQVTVYFKVLFRYLFKIRVFFLKPYVWNENNVCALYKALSKYLWPPEYLALTSEKASVWSNVFQENREKSSHRNTSEDKLDKMTENNWTLLEGALQLHIYASEL